MSSRPDLRVLSCHDGVDPEPPGAKAATRTATAAREYLQPRRSGRDVVSGRARASRRSAMLMTTPTARPGTICISEGVRHHW